MLEKKGKYSIEPVSRVAMFYLPAAKVWCGDDDLKGVIEKFLIEISNSSTYGLSENPHFGHWKCGGKSFREQHIEYAVAIEDDNCVLRLEQFLAKLANIIDEERIYMMIGDGKWIVPRPKEGNRA